MVKIVVIEDDYAIATEVTDWLQLEGYDVVTVSEGQLGLETIHNEIPDLIVCDIFMPEVDGHEVLIEVRSDPTLNHIPFVFFTSATDRDSVRKGMNLGADDYLPKPVTHEELINSVRSRLNKYTTQHEQTQSLINILNEAFSEEREKRLVKSRMVAMFSHDFRNPLSTILISSGMIRNYEDRLSPERKKKHLERIDGSVHLLIQMLDDMLTVAELEDGKLRYLPQIINLTVFVEALAEEFRLIDEDSHKLTIHSSLKSWVQADPKLLRQILANLISNAIKYSSSGTEVTITLSAEDAHTFNLSVQDQGIGIPEESLSQLFEPFYRASNTKSIQGTGLGLSIVKDCVERHNGHIDVSSEINKGTTFFVDFPIISE